MGHLASKHAGWGTPNVWVYPKIVPTQCLGGPIFASNHALGLSRVTSPFVRTVKSAQEFAARLAKTIQEVDQVNARVERLKAQRAEALAGGNAASFPWVIRVIPRGDHVLRTMFVADLRSGGLLP